MTLDRRQMMVGGLGLGAGLAGATAGPRDAAAQAASAGTRSVTGYGVRPGAKVDQTSALQDAIDKAAADGAVLHLPAGAYLTQALTLPSGVQLSGVPGRSILEVTGERGITASAGGNVQLSGLTFDGNGSAPHAGGNASALFSAAGVERLTITGCTFTGSRTNGVSLRECSGRVTDNEIIRAGGAGLFCTDSLGLDIAHNHVHDCGNNGILVWRSREGEDGTTVTGNRIANIAAQDGGSGQNGNGINVFRAGSVIVSANRITDCAFTAVRGNAASNLQIIGNSCERLGEVALYAEFGFEGAIIANNLVDRAASGISITNFNEGGRMAVAQGNLIRNLALRDGERGVGIAVEADAMVTGNVIEGAPGGGIMIGWEKYLRDVNATGNLIRDARIGIGISVSPEAGYAYVTNNMITGAKDGAIRAMNRDTPLGPDLARTSSESYRNIAVIGNVAL